MQIPNWINFGTFLLKDFFNTRHSVRTRIDDFVYRLEALTGGHSITYTLVLIGAQLTSGMRPNCPNDSIPKTALRKLSVSKIEIQTHFSWNFITVEFYIFNFSKHRYLTTAIGTQRWLWRIGYVESEVLNYVMGKNRCFPASVNKKTSWLTIDWACFILQIRRDTSNRGHLRIFGARRLFLVGCRNQHCLKRMVLGDRRIWSLFYTLLEDDLV